MKPYADDIFFKTIKGEKHTTDLREAFDFMRWYRSGKSGKVVGFMVKSACLRLTWKS